MDVNVIDTLSPVLLAIKSRALDPREPLEAIGEHMVSSTVETFEQQGRPEKWKPLSLATLLGRAGLSFIGGRIFGWEKAFTKKALSMDSVSMGSLNKRAQKKMTGAQILKKSGRLVRSITKRAVKGGVEWGSNVIYAALQNYGGKAGRNMKVTVPARQFIHEPFPEDWDFITTTLKNYVFEAAT